MNIIYELKVQWRKLWLYIHYNNILCGGASAHENYKQTELIHTPTTTYKGQKKIYIKNEEENIIKELFIQRERAHTYFIYIFVYTKPHSRALVCNYH